MKGEYTSQKGSHGYQLNIKLTLRTIASGIGPTNLAQLLSFLDLPNIKIVNGRFFQNMELIVGPILRQVGTKVMGEALEEEIELILGSEGKFEMWKQGNLPVSITVSFDMGWNERSSGTRYDSISGHPFFIGCLSKKIVAAIVSSKICAQCSIAGSNGEVPRIHVYPRNYDGSSKGTETDTTLHLYTSLFNDNDKKLF